MIENPNVICNDCGFCKQNKILEQQLAIAVEALDLYKNLRGDGTLKNYESVAVKALQQIKELEK